MSIDETIESSYEIWFKMNNFYEEWAKNRGISANSLMIFYLISKSKLQVTPKFISEKLSLPKQTVTSVLNILEKDGYLVRKTNKYNKRERLIFLTDKGESFSEKVLKDLYETEFNAYSTLNEIEREQFLNTNHKVLDGLGLT